MEPLIIFLIAGQISLIGFKGSHNVMRSPSSEQPAWALSERGQLFLYLFFSVSGLCYIFILVYGFFHLDWWIPVATMIIGFPLAYYFLIRPIIGDIFSMTIGTILSLLSIAFVIGVWFF